MSKSVILVGAGYSILEGINKGLWKKISHKEIWSLNYAFMTMPYLPTRELWVDRSFFKNNMIALQELSQKGVMSVAKKHPQMRFIGEIIQYETIRNPKEYYGKEAIKKGKIFCGNMGLVGTFGLSLAIAEGYDEIWLLGYDFGVPPNERASKKTHYYQDKLNIISSGVKRPEVYISPNNTIKKYITDFEVYKQEEDVNIINVSLISNISSFPKMDYNTFFLEMEKDKCQNG